MTPRIDAHQHFWRIGRGDYGWLTADKPALFRDFGPEDLRPLLDRNGIGGTILVQAAPTEAETAFLLGIAAEEPRVLGVVGWTEFTDPRAADRIAALAGDTLLVGLRPMVQDIAEDDWLLRPELDAAFRAVTELGLVFDALVLPRHLRRLEQVVAAHPALSVVIDHGAKPEIRDRAWQPWADDIARLARYPNTRCKISGLVTEAAADWRPDDLRRYVEHLREHFGADRLLWGSDWPVVTNAASYDRWCEVTLQLTEDWGEAERAALLGGTASRTYLTRRGRAPEGGRPRC
ncbi:amidohydrolase family protein [Roseomonas elaeocarpi]|uniref:Amidohydrolase family protein n=1 Tax=Roseomonas elaeocarpi TaxID=907779 RepID=A0ABV6JSN4_9PROT